VGSGEQVFVSDSLNLGVALFLGVAGIVLGLIGVILSNRFRPLRVLLLFASSAMLFGDLTGWLLRSAGPSKYTSPAGLLYPVLTPRD
jgi:zinc transporter ZupT